MRQVVPAGTEAASVESFAPAELVWALASGGELSPRCYVLNLVRAAVAAGATEVKFEVGADHLSFSADSAPVAFQSDAAWTGEGSSADRAREELGLAWRKAKGLNPSRLVLGSGELELALENGVVTERQRPGKAGRGLFLLLMEGQDSPLLTHSVELKQLAERCRAADIPISIDGQRVSFGFAAGLEELAGALVSRRGRTQVAIAFEPGRPAGCLEFCSLGVLEPTGCATSPKGDDSCSPFPYTVARIGQNNLQLEPDATVKRNGPGFEEAKLVYEATLARALLALFSPGAQSAALPTRAIALHALLRYSSAARTQLVTRLLSRISELPLFVNARQPARALSFSELCAAKSVELFEEVPAKPSGSVKAGRVAVIAPAGSLPWRVITELVKG